MCQDLWFFWSRPWRDDITRCDAFPPGSSSEGSTNHDSPTAGNVCVGPCRKDVESWSFFVMADAVNLPEPKGLPTLLGLNQNVVWEFFRIVICIRAYRVRIDWWMEDSYHGKKTGTKLEAFIGFRLIPKMKDCDFKVFACKKKEATIRNLKDCIDKWQMNDIHWWNSFLGESIFWQRFSSCGFLFSFAKIHVLICRASTMATFRIFSPGKAAKNLKEKARDQIGPAFWRLGSVERDHKNQLKSLI